MSRRSQGQRWDSLNKYILCTYWVPGTNKYQGYRINKRDKISVHYRGTHRHQTNNHIITTLISALKKKQRVKQEDVTRDVT